MSQASKKNHSYRILVVEDDSEMRSLLTDELSAEGYEVVQAEDGAKAAVMVARDHFDLVITDVKMPKMGGIALLPVVKEVRPAVPVIVITAFGEGHTRVEAYEKGAVDYLSKPFKMQDLKDAVSNALKRKGGGSQ